MLGTVDDECYPRTVSSLGTCQAEMGRNDQPPDSIQADDRRETLPGSGLALLLKGREAE